MIFADRFTVQEKIELLQRSILVNSYAYYELNENILTDFQYDANTRMLRQLKREFPEEYSKSRYFKYFEHFESGTGFDMMGMLAKDKELSAQVYRDAALSLDIKGRRGDT